MRNITSLDNQANKIELQTKYAQDKITLQETAKKEGFSPTETNGERLRLALRNNQSNVLNDARFKQQQEDKTFSNSQRLQQSNIDVLSARSESLQGLGLSTLDKPVQKQIAIQQQAISYAGQINELLKLKDSTDLSNSEFITLKTNIENINAIKLDTINQSFSDLSEVAKGFASDFQGVTKDFILNSSNIGESFSKLIQSLLSQFAQLASKQLSDQLMSFLGGGKGKYQGSNQDNSVGGGFGSILSSVGSLFGGGSNGGSDFSSFLGSGSSGDSFSFLGGFASGGMVGDIAKSMQRETLLSGNKAHLIVANDGERVLNPQETKIYNRLVSARRIPSYADGGMIGDGGTLTSTLSGQGSGGVSVSIGDIHVPGSGDGTASGIDAPMLQKALKAAIVKEIYNSRRPGGALNTNRPGLYDR